jgi:hypothetical protein
MSKVRNVIIYVKKDNLHDHTAYTVKKPSSFCRCHRIFPEKCPGYPLD